MQPITELKDFQWRMESYVTRLRDRFDGAPVFRGHPGRKTVFLADHRTGQFYFGASREGDDLAPVLVMLRTLFEEGSSLGRLLAAVPEAVREWRASQLERAPIRLRSAWRYAALHRTGRLLEDQT